MDRIAGDDLAAWLLRTVGSASTIQQAKKSVERLMEDHFAVARVARDLHFSDEFLGNVVRARMGVER